MSKTIKVYVTCELEVPDNAEIIKIEDEEGVKEDYLRVAGKLVRPAIHWMEYLNKERMKDDPYCKAAGFQSSMGFEQVDDDLANGHLMPKDFERYYLEEAP